MTDSILNILLIEDNPGDAELIRNMLRNPEEQYRVTAAERLPDGLKILENGSIDVVLLDLGLPGSAGIDTLLKFQGQGPDLPVIVLTGLADEELALAAISAGAQDYLVKGQIDRGLLLRTIRHAIERKRAQEALKESEERFRSIASTAMDAVILIDNDGKVLFWNQAATKIFGYTNEEVIGTHLHDAVMPRRHRVSYMKGFGNFRSTGKGPFIGTVYETEARKKDGTEFPVELSLAALKLKGKWGAVGIVRDISERKIAEKRIMRLNQDLNAKVADLEHAVRELDAFSYSVSHDLRAPLRIISGLSDMLLDDYHHKLAGEGRKLLSTIKGHVKKMDELIEGLLKLSRVGRQNIQLAEIDMGKLGREVLEELVSDADKGRLQLVVNDMPLARADRVLIRQVLVNLLSNALKFTRGKDHSKIEIKGRAEKGFNVYTVCDNGIGFEMKYSEKLFDVFHRLHHKGDFEGVGVGLSIVRRIIERHGGHVCAEGKPNEGATFYFTLPNRVED